MASASKRSPHPARCCPEALGVRGPCTGRLRSQGASGDPEPTGLQRRRLPPQPRPHLDHRMGGVLREGGGAAFGPRHSLGLFLRGSLQLCLDWLSFWFGLGADEEPCATTVLSIVRVRENSKRLLLVLIFCKSHLPPSTPRPRLPPPPPPPSRYRSVGACPGHACASVCLPIALHMTPARGVPAGWGQAAEVGTDGGQPPSA